MKIKIRFSCFSGVAEVFHDRARPDGVTTQIVLAAGQYHDCELADIPDENLPADPTLEDIAAAFSGAVQSAWNTPGIGAYSTPDGVVAAEPLTVPLVVRRYVTTNAFLEPDAPDHYDHELALGEKVVADMTGSNVVTLMPLLPRKEA